MKEKPGTEEILGLLVLAAAIAVLTYPMLRLTGIHDLLVYLSIYFAKAIFALLGI